MFLKITNQNVVFPYTLTQFLADNSETSFGTEISAELLSSYGVYPVVNSAPPQVNSATHAVRHAQPILADGQWTETWEVMQLPEHTAADNIRAIRNSLLSQHVDTINAIRWSLMLPETQQMWVDYRQALLDVPDQAGFPYSVEWPVIP
jgi:hypothetical protein